MHTTTKGALAVGVAAVLLTGGAGSLAYWSDTQVVTANTPLASGQLKLGAPACGTGWVLDGGAVFTNQLIVPGDVLTRTCTIDLIAKGEHLGADLAISTAAFATTNALTQQLAPSASFTVAGATRNHITEQDDTGAANEISAKITVTFDGPAATNASQALSATLNSVSVTATQTHDPV